jgi:hypothetical protein
MKTKIYALIFVLLIGLVGYTLFNNARQEKNSKRDKNFKVENFEAVTRIDVVEKSGEKMSMKKVGDNWILNDKYPVNMHLFKDVKEALSKMEAINPVASVATENVIFEMVQHAIKVSVFEGEDKPSKVIYVGGPNISNSASNMFLEFDGVPSKKIYEVSLPGFSGYLTTRFLVNEADWRSKEIFNYAPDEFKEIEIKYLNDSGNTDFVLAKKDDSYALKFNGNTLASAQLNQKNVISYILQLRNKLVLDYSFQKPNEAAIKDSLLSVHKFAEMKITDADNQVQLMTIVNMPVNQGSNVKYDVNGDPLIVDVDYKYIVFGEEKDWGIVSKDNFGKLFIDPVKFIKQ